MDHVIRTLNKRIMNVSYMVPIDNFLVTTRIDEISNRLAIQLKQSFYSEDLGPVVLQEERTILVPINWWNHLVEDCMPVWYKKYFPVKFSNIKIPKIMSPSFSVAYPEYNGIKNGGQAYIRIVENKRHF